MTKMNENNGPKDGVPLWIKRAGAVLGIIATAATIFIGVYTLVLEYAKFSIQIEKERTEQSRANEAASKNLRDQKQTELEIEEQQTHQIEMAKKSAYIEFQRRSKEMEFEEAARIRNEAAQREQRILQAISDFVDSDKPALSPLVILSEYAEPKGDYQDLIITAFVAKTEKIESLAEARLIFNLLDGIGVDALNAVVQINRIALKQFSDALLRLFWSQVQITIESHVKNPQEDGDEITSIFEPDPSYLIAPIILQISRQVFSIDPRFQALLMTEEWERFEASYKAGLWPTIKRMSTGDPDIALEQALITSASRQVDASFTLQDKEALHGKLIVNGEILNQSKQFIERFLPEAASSLNNNDQKIDLSNTYLVGLQINSGDFRNLSIDFDNTLFSPKTDIFAEDTMRSSLNDENASSFLEAQQTIERRLRKMEEFMTL